MKTLIIISAISVCCYAFIIIKPIYRSPNTTNTWTTEEECKKLIAGVDDGYYVVTVDNVKYFTRSEPEVVSGFPLVLILRRGNDTITVKGNCRVVVERVR